ncbi:MAG: AzlD domain-containing protein [Hyphomicrobiaceae bacterium]
MRPDVLAAILAMAVAAFLCRAGGYFLMRYVPITPRVEVALRMIPMAIVASMLAVAATRGGPPEWAGIAAAMATMAAVRNDFAAILAGIATVAGLRLLI